MIIKRFYKYNIKWLGEYSTENYCRIMKQIKILSNLLIKTLCICFFFEKQNSCNFFLMIDYGVLFKTVLEPSTYFVVA